MLKGLYRAEDGKQYPARVLAEGGGFTTLSVLFPDGYGEHPAGTTIQVSVPSDAAGKIFTPDTD